MSQEPAETEAAPPSTIQEPVDASPPSTDTAQLDLRPDQLQADRDAIAFTAAPIGLDGFLSGTVGNQDGCFGFLGPDGYVLPILFTAVDGLDDIVVSESGTVIEVSSVQVVLGDNLESGGGILQYDDLLRRDLDLSYPDSCPTVEVWAASSLRSE